ncbi:MAG: 4Fe-4S binding protein [Candidatus Aegiribacteria sp.]|nr:4Fe-4S binding protein [Candidatus Aegiribacteria sp.]
MNRKKCIMCLCCHELCPERAIKIRIPLGIG